MTDLATFGETMLRFTPPRGERLETATRLDCRPGGAESNVAVAASALGLDAAWLSKLPDTPPGRRIVRGLRSHGVTPGVAWAEEGRVGTYYLEPGGEPRGSRIVYDRADSAVTTATPEELPVGAVRTADRFCTSGITPALSETLAATTRTLLREASDAGTSTVFDLNYRAKLWSPAAAREGCEALFPHVDTFVAAERDVECVLDREGQSVDVATGLATDYGFGTVVLTMGEHGAVAISDGELHEQAAFEADTVDRVGTGDAFLGGYLARRARGGTVGDALAWGSATAALKRTVNGDAAVVTPAEVEAILDGDGVGIAR